MFASGFFADGMFADGFFAGMEAEQEVRPRPRGGWRLHGSYSPPVQIKTEQDFLEQLAEIRLAPGAPLPACEAVVVVRPPRIRVGASKFDLLFGGSRRRLI